MHDPRLGVFGGAAIALDLLLKVSVLSALVAGPRFPVEAIAAGAIGRGVAIALTTVLPYVGPGSGTGGWTRDVALGPRLMGVVSAMVLGVFTVGPAFGAMAAAGVVVAAIVGRWSSRRLGGVTGDTLGAATELTETLALTAALALR
jgi:adenosylcobinamide-GDP ribazoletransferase